MAVMKVFLVVVVIGLFTVFARKPPCSETMPCYIGECCVPNFLGNGFICREYGEDIGDLCGGDYFCTQCSYNMRCIPEPNPNNVTRLANGTCQVPPLVATAAPTASSTAEPQVSDTESTFGSMVDKCPVIPPLNP